MALESFLRDSGAHSTLKTSLSLENSVATETDGGLSMTLALTHLSERRNLACYFLSDAQAEDTHFDVPLRLSV